ncbi:hypothetical protein A3B51_00620 [Candidatus Curtissbacteria bacterium RIFCSPLOWO2_01_FULL_41_18]|uniref:Glycosyl transferase family 1 n=1 Tax=Candidatus Curtissbacteria bacterium RIFCSPLOWO2_01_FULL_41_18 TaxID=1797727 RepID=A0A1F5HHY0_9BACT|nr:MAG: hypothetical protein A3B51_00620 [Candidatus Curtissbacteria bacterium RIFCSPLOWO2_01_FULL_41_18]
MRIAVIIDTWFPFMGGGQINAWEISNRIARSGAKVDIITRNNGKDNLKGLKNLQVYKLGSKSNPNDSFSKATFLVRSFFFAFGKNYDLIHAHAFLPGITAKLLMLTKNIPAVLTVHGTSINTQLNNFFSRALEKFILTQIRYSSQISVSQDFLKFKNINKRINYIPNGVNIKLFDKQAGSESKTPTLIFVGRLHPQKNLKNLIAAIKIVQKKIPNIKLLIIGAGELKASLQNQVRELKLKNNVKFLGQKTGNDLIKLYKSSQVFILPSIYEGQPISLLEAWAAKLAVIVSKTGDCQYMVKDGKNGYHIKSPDDASEIADVIQKAFSNKNLENLGIAGYNLVKKSFSWEKSAEQILNMYEQIAYN